MNIRHLFREERGGQGRREGFHDDEEVARRGVGQLADAGEEVGKAVDARGVDDGEGEFAPVHGVGFAPEARAGDLDVAFGLEVAGEADDGADAVGREVRAEEGRARARAAAAWGHSRMPPEAPEASFW